MTLALPTGYSGSLFSAANVQDLAGKARLRQVFNANYDLAADHLNRASDFLMVRAAIENNPAPGEWATWHRLLEKKVRELLLLISGDEAERMLREPVVALIDAGLPLTAQSTLAALQPMLLQTLEELRRRTAVLAAAAEREASGDKHPKIAVPEFLRHSEPAYQAVTGRPYGRPKVEYSEADKWPPACRFIASVASHIWDCAPELPAELQRELKRLQKGSTVAEQLRRPR